MNVIFNGTRLTVALLLLFGFLTIGHAQTADIRGTVQRVDVSNSTVYFTDGRAVRLDPGTRLYAGGREVRLADVQPGWVFVSSATTATPGTVVVQPGAAPASTAASASSASAPVTGSQTPAIDPSAPRIDATGVVASVDAATGIITLQDGRIIRIQPGTTLWQPITMGSVAPGASVFIRNAQPLDFRPQAQLPSARPLQMGTVSSVDASNARVVLSDGTVVHLRPGSRLMFNGQSLAISDLRPGDEVVVGMPPGSAVAVPSATPAVTSIEPAVSALPRQTLGVIEGEYLYVVRQPQSP
jgi:hypothetical protein